MTTFTRSVQLVLCAWLSACSFAFVESPTDAMRTNRDEAATCTTSRTLPVADVVIGAVAGGLAAAATYAAVERINEDCIGGACYTPWKPALLTTFLVVSPWWISAAVGFSDTGRCREIQRQLGMQN